jgi:hypothetical protein
MYAVLQSPYLVLQFANLGVVHGVLRAATGITAACAARLAARRLRVLVPPSSVVREIYAMRADAIRYHAQVIMPVGQVRQLETNRLQGSTGRHPHSAEVVSPAIVDLVCSFIFQPDEGINHQRAHPTQLLQQRCLILERISPQRVSEVRR